MNEFVLLHAPALCIAIPLLFAFIVPLAEKLGSKVRNAFVLLGFLAALSVILLLAQNVLETGTLAYTMGADSSGITLPSGLRLPVRIILEVDALSVLMASMAGVVGLLAAVYSFGFMKGTGLGKFYSLFFVMFAGLMGLFLTGDIFTMFVFFEIFAIASVALVAYWFNKKEAVEASFKYLVVSSVASLFLLFSIGLLYGQFGLLNIAGLAVSIDLSLVSLIALGLLVVAFAMKAGAAPMHQWLPDAYGESPTPVTILLGIGTLSSLYALLRITFSLFGSYPLIPIVAWFFIFIGLVSMLIGVMMALKQDDIKRLIAFTAVSQTGFILLAMGVGLTSLNSPGLFSLFGENALRGGLFHLFNHGLYEALLFMAAGAIVFATGTRKLSEMSGLAKKMPYTTVFFLLGAMAIAGIPPLNGFASKILIYESVYYFNPLLTVLALVVSVLTLVPFIKAFSAAFLGPQTLDLKKVKEVPKTMLFGMLVLTIIVILIGLFPQIVLDYLISPAVDAISNQAGFVEVIL